jgi:hypothetical protein
LRLLIAVGLPLDRRRVTRSLRTGASTFRQLNGDSFSLSIARSIARLEAMSNRRVGICVLQSKIARFSAK